MKRPTIGFTIVGLFLLPASGLSAANTGTASLAQQGQETPRIAQTSKRRDGLSLQQVLHAQEFQAGSADTLDALLLITGSLNELVLGYDDGQQSGAYQATSDAVRSCRNWNPSELARRTVRVA